MKRMVTVTNKHTALLHLPSTEGFEGVTLHPGKNEVLADYLEALHGHKGVESWLAAGYLDFGVPEEPEILTPTKLPAKSPDKKDDATKP